MVQSGQDGAWMAMPALAAVTPLSDGSGAPRLMRSRVRVAGLVVDTMGSIMATFFALAWHLGTS